MSLCRCCKNLRAVLDKIRVLEASCANFSVVSAALMSRDNIKVAAEFKSNHSIAHKVNQILSVAMFLNEQKHTKQFETKVVGSASTFFEMLNSGDSIEKIISSLDAFVADLAVWRSATGDELKDAKTQVEISVKKIMQQAFWDLATERLNEGDASRAELAYHDALIKLNALRLTPRTFDTQQCEQFIRDCVRKRAVDAAGFKAWAEPVLQQISELQAPARDADLWSTYQSITSLPQPQWSVFLVSYIRFITESIAQIYIDLTNLRSS